MSAEGPVRKPTSEPPDVDSLMSRLDGQADEGERLSDPGGERRPSAAELLGGRGRRTKRTIRVPDDAVPAATPPNPARRPSVPPPVADERRPSVPPPAADSPMRIMPSRIIAVGGSSPSYIPPPARPAERSPVAASEPTPIAPAVAAMPVAAPPAPPISERPAAIAETRPAFGASAIAPLPEPVPPTSDIRIASASPVAQMELANESLPVANPPPADQPPPQKQPTLQNLDAQVKEALALLDREDFETTVDIQVADLEETNPAAPVIDVKTAIENAPNSSEESLDDAIEEEVVAPQPSKKVHTAPTPPPRKPQPSTGPVSVPTQAAAQPAATLPSAAITSPEAVSQPKIVVAAAATASAAPAAAAISSPAPSTGPASNPLVDQTGELRKKKRQWFEELFNDDYARTLPKFSPKFLDREVGFIEESLGCDKGATILDLGCGPGEQAVALAARGYEVIGIDLSLAMLARAADEAAEKNQRINFLQGDMRDLTFDDAFDGIYCWGTTFGYFDDQKNVEVVQKIHKALRRGGRFLLDVANRDYIVPRTPSMVWFEGEGCVCMDEVSVNAITSRLQVKRTMMMEDGRQREIDYSIRLYALHELGKLLHENGFRVAEASGDTSTPGTYFGSESPRILILAEKR